MLLCLNIFYVVSVKTAQEEFPVLGASFAFWVSGFCARTRTRMFPPFSPTQKRGIFYTFTKQSQDRVMW
ncbi:MAG TPA: hypothetical protein DCE42_04190 [Myxococcales bacterium]|nr:hypothetical protein [Deltaproteobacteria bacterium]MBU47683.1 hypothetical protein [Deltaproteobacteria bacterium]HAA53926.1 hypothetical protein [Myxococcales bacterium]